jgi:hypothetical protein
MFLTLIWTFWAIVWGIQKLPSSSLLRDRILADRAVKTLRMHFRRAGTIRACDPYAAPMKIDCDHPRVAMQGIRRASAILVRHSLPHHLMNALLRQFDPSAKAQAAAQPEYQPRTEPST